MASQPKIVCLCGSTRFKAAFDEANYQETMAGRIVLSVGFATGNRHGEEVGATPDQKIALDELHKRKIDLCDEVLVLNVGGYIGSSTRSEIDYAVAHGKPVRYLEEARPGRGMMHESEREADHKLDLTRVRLHSLNCPTPDTLECECLPRASAAAFASILSALFEAGLGGEAVKLILRRDRLARGEFKR